MAAYSSSSADPLPAAGSGPSFPVAAIEDDGVTLQGTAVQAGEGVCLLLQYGYVSITVRAVAAQARNRARQRFTVPSTDDRELLELARTLARLPSTGVTNWASATVLPSWVPTSPFEPKAVVTGRASA
jgi:hypothetical protein